MKSKEGVKFLGGVGILLWVLTATASAGLAVYPAKGQSPEQQQKDESECHAWAVKSSGYDPANPPTVPQSSSTRVTGTGARMRGAVGGAIVGEIADGDTGDAALAGAAIGGMSERRRQRMQHQETQNRAIQEQQSGLSAYNKAKAACLEGRGYSVK